MSTDNIVHIAVDSFPLSDGTWIDILSALLVPLIAILSAYIAYQQYRINLQRLRHETYERRLSIYRCVQVYLSEILKNSETTETKALKFYSDVAEVGFLFDNSIQNKIDEIYKKSIKMISLSKKLYHEDGSVGLPIGDERDNIAKEEDELLAWHIEQLTEIRALFGKKLGVCYIKEE